MSAEPISEERLAALRRLDLNVLLPGNDRWNPATRRQAARWASLFAPIINELLDEIEELDAAVDASETEVESLKRQQAFARQPVDRGPMGLRRLPSGRWQVHWYSDGKRHSKSFPLRWMAEECRAALHRQARDGGVR